MTNRYIAKIFLLIIAVSQFGLSCATENFYKPDSKFLEKSPYKRIKATVDLSTLRNDFELSIVKNASDDIIRFVFVFALGNRYADSRKIMENPRTHPFFASLTTEKGRKELDIEPLSGRFARKIFNWNIESTTTLSVDVTLQHMPDFEDGPPESPNLRTYRFSFVKSEEAKSWRMDGAQRLY